MKVAHFAIFAPHGSGQYETVKDLILAERSVGIDAQFVDFGSDKKGTNRNELSDGEVHTVPLAWAFDEADIVVRHTSIPEKILDEKPVICALHGRPENSFRLEQYKTAFVISSLRKAASEGKHKAFITFWPEYLFYWSRMLGIKIFFVPPPVDLNTYIPDGLRHSFGKHEGSPNIVVADRWREDRTPFNLIFAAQYFRENFYPDAKLHIYGISITKSSAINFFARMQKRKNNGVVGQTFGVMAYIADVYRGADFILTPNMIATRIVRESMASGLPMVAPLGCQYTPFTAEPRDLKSFALAMKECWEYPTDHIALRKQAKDLFGPEKVGQMMKQLLERFA